MENQQHIKELLSKPSLSDEEWLEARHNGLGATDIAVLSGLHPFRKPSAVYADKRRLLETEENYHMWWGKREEPLIMERFSYETGHSLIPVLNRNFTHHEFAWAMATPDAFLSDITAGVECKSVSISQRYRWGESWSDVVPEEYFIQCQWDMFVTGLDLWYLVAKMDRELYYYVIQRKPTLIEKLFNRGREFWYRYIEGDELPPPDESDDFKALMDVLYPESTQDDLPAQPNDYDLMEKYGVAKKEYDRASDEINKIKNTFRSIIGEHTGIAFPDAGRISWTGGEKRRTVSYSSAFDTLVKLLREKGIAVPDELVLQAIRENTVEKAGTRSIRLSNVKLDKLKEA